LARIDSCDGQKFSKSMSAFAKIVEAISGMLGKPFEFKGFEKVPSQKKSSPA
jgi:hypothetical protein